MSELKPIRLIPCPKNYLDILLLIANAIKIEQVNKCSGFFPVGLEDPPIVEDFGLRFRLSKVFAPLGVRFVWDYQANIMWAHKTVREQMKGIQHVRV